MFILVVLHSPFWSMNRLTSRTYRPWISQTHFSVPSGCSQSNANRFSANSVASLGPSCIQPVGERIIRLAPVSRIPLMDHDLCHIRWQGLAPGGGLGGCVYSLRGVDARHCYAVLFERVKMLPIGTRPRSSKEERSTWKGQQYVCHRALSVGRWRPKDHRMAKAGSLKVRAIVPLSRPAEKEGRGRKQDGQSRREPNSFFHQPRKERVFLMSQRERECRVEESWSAGKECTNANVSSRASQCVSRSGKHEMWSQSCSERWD